MFRKKSCFSGLLFPPSDERASSKSKPQLGDLDPFVDCGAVQWLCCVKLYRHRDVMSLLPRFLWENNWASMAWRRWPRFVKIDDLQEYVTEQNCHSNLSVRQQRHLVEIQQSFTRQCAFLDNFSQLITFVHQHFISNFAIKNSSTAKNHLSKQSFSPNIYIVTTSFPVSPDLLSYCF